MKFKLNLASKIPALILGLCNNVKSYLFIFLVLSITSQNVYSGAIKANWDANTEPDLKGYKLYYGTVPSDYLNWESVDVGNVNSYLVGNLDENVTYYFVVTAYDSSGNESAPSDEVSALVTGPQATASVSGDSIIVRWTFILDADSYEIFQGTEPFFTPGTPVATITENSWIDTSFPQVPDTAAYYIVKAMSGGSVSHTFNTIGAYNVPIKYGNNLVSLPFAQTDSSLCGVLGTQLHGATNAVQADKVYIRENDAYSQAWLVEGTTSPLEGKWVTPAGDGESTLKINPSESFWIISRSIEGDSLFTMTGTVNPDSNRAVSLVPGPNFVSVPYPVEVSLTQGGLNEEGVIEGSYYLAGSDKVMMWTGSKYEIAWLVDGTNTSWDGKWVNERGDSETTMTLKPGRGYIIWIKNEGPARTWKFPNPKYN